MSVECQVNVKSQSELDVGGRETCSYWGGAVNLEGLKFDIHI